MTSPSPAPSPSVQGAGSDDAALPVATARLAVEGMHCEACTALIEETLHERSGVISAEVDLGDSRAVVRYDPSRLGPEDLRDSIADAGYTATVVS